MRRCMWGGAPPPCRPPSPALQRSPSPFSQKVCKRNSWSTKGILSFVCVTGLRTLLAARSLRVIMLIRRVTQLSLAAHARARGPAAMTCAITPPLNFAHVGPGVYRSGFPGRHNLTFLQRLGLRTLVRLEAAEYPPEVAAWIEEQGIRIVQCATTRNREPFVSMNQAVLLTALRALLDHQNHPVLVHGLRGQQRTGVVVGCLRRLQRWSLSPTFDEYRRHAATASSLLDLQQIELFDPSLRSSAPSTAEDETLAESDGAETGYQRSTI